MSIRTAVTITAVAVLGCGSAASALPRPPAPTVARQQVSPGENPAVQRWFKSREKLQIELNDALQAARSLTAPSSAVCARLTVATFRFGLGSTVPEVKLQPYVYAGLPEFMQAAQACTAGDLATMRQRMDEGAASRSTALDHIDEILDNEE
ncbi:hypothetical protein [Lentzea nigeriaca]|uniref:hypothetical protein n=1 Tax=Lentzea nigeriaca TaxID=1128665 RepID=UPI00195C93D4|nr:hypothetical protein [Lentzea nigeriaca]MBM7857215.1 hypothetical protein [Lentzea nigeriaca]